jgi:hypothetical protein
MSSLVGELQRGALENSTEITELLRKAYAVATKLKLEQFKSWCEFELNGYPVSQEVPEYRISRGTLRAWNPYNGCAMPIMFTDDPATQDVWSTHKNRGPVSAAQDLLHTGGNMFLVELSPQMQMHLMRGTDTDFESSLHIGRGALVKLVDGVRNTILNWSLQLEADGISGDGLSFNSSEKEIAQQRSADLQSVVNFINIGSMTNSSIQQSSPKSHQRMA